MAYFFYHENALLGPYSVFELKSKVQGHDLVKDDSGTWRPASSLPGWKEADDDIAQQKLLEASSSKVGQPDGQTEGVVREPFASEMIKDNVEHWQGVDDADERRKQDTAQVDFPFFQPRGIGRYFKYDNEYISGGTYFKRVFLQSFLYYILGLGFYLQMVTVYKRLRSTGSKERAGLFTAMYAVSALIIFGVSLDPYPSETTIMTTGLLAWVGIFFHWWLTLVNSKNPMFGGVDALIQKLKITDVGRLTDLQEILSKEELLRSEQGIPDDVVLLPALHHAPDSLPNAYCLALRDSKKFYTIQEFSTLEKGVKLLRKTPEFEKEYAAFKLRILNP